MAEVTFKIWPVNFRGVSPFGWTDEKKVRERARKAAKSKSKGMKSRGRLAGGSRGHSTIETPVVAPVNLVAPVITGNVGDVLTCSTGAWNSLVGTTLSRQWKNAADDSALGGDDGEIGSQLVTEIYHGLSVYCTLTATNALGSVSINSNTVGPLVDVVAPVLSDAFDTKTSDTTATIGATTDEVGGTLYAVASALQPTATQLKTGKTSTGATAAIGVSQVVTAIGVRTILVTGLTAATTYDQIWFLHEDAAGNQSNVVDGDGFTTDAIPDVTNPTVSTFSPADNATGVSTTAALVVTFSEPIVYVSGAINVYDSDDLLIESFAEAVAILIEDDVLTITLTEALQEGKGHYVQIATTAIDDLAGNSFAGITNKTTWNFTTEDVIAPVVLAYSPPANATEVAINSTLVATFDETVTLGAAGLITLKKTSDDSTIDSWNVALDSGPGAGQVEVLTNTALTLHLTTDLDFDIEHYVIWDAGVVKDAANNNVAALSETETWTFATVASPDTIAPTIQTFSPVNNSALIPLAASLVATFSENIAFGTGAIELFDSDNDLIESFNVATEVGTGNGQVSIAGAVLTINPTASMEEAKGHYVKIAATAIDDIAGNSFVGIADEVTWAFTTADVTAPTITTLSPVDGATGVAVAANLTATFSEPISFGPSVDVSLHLVSDDSLVEEWDALDVDTNLTIINSTTLMLINPTADLTPSTAYYVLISAGSIVDAEGNPFAGIAIATTWNFTTQAATDTVAPTVQGFLPLDNAVDVAIGITLVATFNEPVTLGASGLITLKKTSDNSTIESWNVATEDGSTAGKVEVVNSTELTLHLTTALANDTEYYVIWDAGAVKDASNYNVVALSSTVTWSFRTVAAQTVYPSLTITSATYTGSIVSLAVTPNTAFASYQYRHGLLTPPTDGAWQATDDVTGDINETLPDDERNYMQVRGVTSGAEFGPASNVVFIDTAAVVGLDVVSNWESSGVDPANLAVYTFAAKAVGSVRTKHLLVGISWRAATAQTLTSLTVGGLTATVVETASLSGGTSRTSFYIVDASSLVATTANIVATFSAAVLRCAINVWSINNLQSTTRTDFAIAAVTASVMTTAVDCPAGGGIFSQCAYNQPTAGITNTWVGVTERSDAVWETNQGYVTAGSLDFAAAVTNRTVSVTPSSGNPDIEAMLTIAMR